MLSLNDIPSQAPAAAAPEGAAPWPSVSSSCTRRCPSSAPFRVRKCLRRSSPITARVSPHSPRHPEPRRRPRDLSEALCGIVHTKPVLQLQRLRIPSIPRLRRDPSAALRRLGMTICAAMLSLNDTPSQAPAAAARRALLLGPPFPPHAPAGAQAPPHFAFENPSQEHTDNRASFASLTTSSRAAQTVEGSLRGTVRDRSHQACPAAPASPHSEHPSPAERSLGRASPARDDRMLCADLMVLENQRSGGGRCPPNPEVRERSPAF